MTYLFFILQDDIQKGGAPFKVQTEEDTQFRIHFKSVKKVEIKSSPNVLAVHGCLFFTSALCYFECKRNFFLLKNTPVGDFEEILYLIINS